MEANNERTVSNFKVAVENPFIKAAQSAIPNSKEISVDCTKGEVENPFFSLSKPLVVSSTKGLNIFGKPQDNSAVIGLPKQSAIPIFSHDSTQGYAAEVLDAKNPFLSSDTKPLKFGNFEPKPAELPNPFLACSEVKPKPSSTLPNPFLENSVPMMTDNTNLFIVSENSKKGIKHAGNFDGVGTLKKSTYTNPFLSAVSVAPIFSSTAPTFSQVFSGKPQNPSQLTTAFVASSEIRNDDFNIYSGGTFPGKLEEKRTRSSLDELKTSLTLLADGLKSVVCTDSESKYDVLEKIDKAIRKGIKSNFHIQDGKRYRALKGTCVDMCPEKERYFRDDKHQISPFELSIVQDIISSLDGNYPKLCHRKAVKEYSRSSADQEEPLPHQLRPASVLSYTMDYLVMNIMDVKYDKRTDWFDFLWNRTRAIRKDITQQNLECLDTISIIEKCARFHIFCSHYLCEHELHIFEPKMNLENLTKCLQTLKHLYEDRWKEHNDILCNEPEFRCYQILLNLNDGDMLREVMHFRKDVRESAPVKFALKIFSAVHDNNYVRFFKLLKSTSYLNACLLQPYFTQIRQSALIAMVRTFSQPNMDVPFPLENLQNILAFDNTEEAMEFCQNYGLSTHDSSVYFNRSSFSKPEEPIPLKMSFVITAKLQSSMSEIVNNGPMEFKLNIHEPVNSFSVEGTYLGSYHLLDDDTFNDSVIEEVKSGKVVEFVEVEVVEVPRNINANRSCEFTVDDANDNAEVEGVGVGDALNVTQVDHEIVENDAAADLDVDELKDVRSDAADPDYDVNEDAAYDSEYSVHSEYSDEEEVVMFLREDFMAYIEDLIIEEIPECIEKLSVNIIGEAKEEMVQSEVMTDQELAIMCIEEARIAVEEVIDEEQLKLEKERQEMIKNESIEFSENLIDESVKSTLHSICTEVHKAEIETLEVNVLADEIEKQSQNVLRFTMNREMTEVASDVINETCLNRKKLLESNKQFILKNKLSKMFNCWIKAYKQQQFIKSSLIDFPPLPPLITTKEAIRKLHPDGVISYSLPNVSGTVKKIIEPKVSEEDPVNISTEDTLIEGEFSKPLFTIIEDGMSLLFFKVFHEHCLYCESLALPTAGPNDIIRFYNDTLLAIKDGLKLVFKDNDVKQLDGLVSILELPLMTEVDPYDWDLCCSECEKLVLNGAEQKSSILFNRIDNILERYLSRSAEDEDIIFPWSEVLEACIFCKMSNMYLEKSNAHSFNFQTAVPYINHFISSLHVKSPLKEHIKIKRTEYFALKNSLTYQDDMRKRKYTRECKLRKSLDDVDSELATILLRKSKSPLKKRSSSLQELFNDTTSFLLDVECVKQKHQHPCNESSYSPPSCFDGDVKEKEVMSVKFMDDKLTGCKRTFEYSMMECLKGIEDYRMKLKTREDYWREIIDQ